MPFDGGPVPLWTLVREGRTASALITSKPAGTEIQFLRDGLLLWALTFPTEAVALKEAEDERQALIGQSWMPVPHVPAHGSRPPIHTTAAVPRREAPPLTHFPSAARRERIANTQGRAGTSLILNVDDRPASLYTREKVLRGHGFEVVNAQTGAEALAAARQLRPELILLDIRLPDADGRDLCRSIKADAELARIPVVLISAYVSGHVAELESVRWGNANGFIREPVEPASLASLLRSVIASAARGTTDRVKVQAMPHQQADRDNFHAVKFYQDRRSLAEFVAQFLGEGFVARLPGIMIATPDHRGAILNALHDRGFDVGRLQAEGHLLLYDADGLMTKFMVNGIVEPVRFTRSIIPVLEKACAGRQHCVVRVYGELVDLLWKAEQMTAAIRLEGLWNQLAQTHEFALLCGYSMGNFYKDAAQTEMICAQHTHILSDSPAPASLQ